MSVWDELDIKSTTDIKLIKRAYAKKLKHTRPDVNPNQFQQLHFAYKQALLEAKQRQQTTPTNQGEKLSEESHFATSDSVNQTATPKSQDLRIHIQDTDDSSSINITTTPIIDASSDTELSRLVDWIEQIIADPSKRNQFELWQRITENPNILDPEFNHQLGLKLFEIVATFNANTQGKRKHFGRIGAKIINYLDDTFNWCDNEAYLRSEFENKLCDSLLPKLSQRSERENERKAIAGLIGGQLIKQALTHKQRKIENYGFGSNHERGNAMLIDTCISGVIGYIILLVIAPEGSTFRAIHIAATYLIGSCLCICSKLQSTPGLLMFGLIVTRHDCQRISYLQGFVRTLTLGAFLLGGFITLIINSMIGPKYIHDRISKTQVISIH